MAKLKLRAKRELYPPICGEHMFRIQKWSFPFGWDFATYVWAPTAQEAMAKFQHTEEWVYNE